MPHLSQLARDYREQDVTIIGLTSEDRRNTIEKVREMVEDKGDGMDYTVAWDEGRATNEAYMAASGQRGIPTAFLVDKAGTLAWIGHPMEADIPLQQVVAGTWDIEKGPALMKEIGQRRMAIYESAQSDPARALALLDALGEEFPTIARGMEDVRFSVLVRLPEHAEEAAQLGRRLVDEAAAAEDSGSLNMIAWSLVDPAAELEERHLDLALQAAEKANALAEGGDPAILDTLARVHAWRGELQTAIELQRKAVELAEGGMKTALEAVLAEYEASLAAADEG